MSAVAVVDARREPRIPDAAARAFRDAGALVVHGSPAARSELHRVLYYEFRAAELELAHTPSYVPLKRRVQQAALRARAAAAWAAGETPFAYRPAAEPTWTPLAAAEPFGAWRVPHHEHWRWDLEQARQARRRAAAG